jgi:hypothetical protein
VNAALLASSLSLGFLFLRDKSAVLKHAATATLQQSVAILFERAERLLAGGDGAAVGAAVKADAAEGDAGAGGPSQHCHARPARTSSSLGAPGGGRGRRMPRT